MRFRTQLATGIGALVALTMLSGIMALIALHATTRTADEVTRRVVRELDAVHDIRLRAEQMVTTARGYLLTGSESHRQQLLAREAGLEASLEVLRPQDEHTAELLSIVEQRVTDYSKGTALVARERVLTNDLQSIEALFEEQVAPLRARLDRAVRDLVQVEHARLDLEALRTRRAVQTVGLALLVGCVTAIAISIALALLVMRKLNAQYRRVEDAQRAAKQAAQSRKELLDIVAHDLRSPLSTIGLGLEVLTLEGGNERLATTLKRSADNMQRLVQDLLDVSRFDATELELKRQPYTAASLLDLVLGQFQNRSQLAGIRLRTETSTGAKVFVDPDRLQQVLSNLIGNAIRFTRPGDEILVSASSGSEAVRFEVVDKGPGIQSGEAEQLFEPYRQGTSRERQGSLGLGLYICKTLVEAHGGRIGVESTPGQGSTFWFELPEHVTPNHDGNGLRMGLRDGLG